MFVVFKLDILLLDKLTDFTQDWLDKDIICTTLLFRYTAYRWLK